MLFMECFRDLCPGFFPVTVYSSCRCANEANIPGVLLSSA
jgi:hypothetical protein